MTDCSRRNLLKALAGFTGVSAASALLPGCIDGDTMPAPYVDAPPVADGVVRVNVAQLPDLAKVGGAVTVRSKGAPDVILIHHAQGEFVALASKCTHAGCPVGFDGDEVLCPCHRSRFDLKGKVLAPPAAGPLRRYPAQLEPDLSVKIFLEAGDGTFPPPENGKLVLKLADYPALQHAGGSLVGTPEGLSDPLMVLALDGNQFAALSATCTHLGCTVNFIAANGDIECPCHGSTFTTAGAVTAGPATRNLPTFPITFDGTSITVTLS